MQVTARWPAQLAGIDWTRPWFAPFAAIGRRIATRVTGGADLRACLDAEAAARALRTQAGLPLRFVAQAALPAGTAYEAHIFATGAVPTRDNLHDFFNGLIWLHFPQAKAWLNAMQAARIADQGMRGPRGAVRDGATLFDENAVLFVSDNEAADVGVTSPVAALRGFDWHALFVAARDDWQRRCVVVPFGHALLEKLVAPYKAVTAHAWPLSPPPSVLPSRLAPGDMDAALAASLRGAALHPRAFSPLPVMGIPGWCEDNRDASFYADTGVFRPGRRTRGQADSNTDRGCRHR